MTRLVLVRHGESDWNVARRVQGQAGSGLSPRGREQSVRTAELLAAAYPDALLVTSDLQRTVETAQPLEEQLGRAARPEVGLRERDFGDWTGLLATEIGERDPQRWERWRLGQDVVGEVGGEDTSVLVERVVSTCRRLVGEVAGGTAICVTHGGPVWHGTHALLGLPHRVLGGVANCSVTEVEVEREGVRARLVAWNQITHLPLELRMITPTGDEEADDVAEEAPPVGT